MPRELDAKVAHIEDRPAIGTESPGRSYQPSWASTAATSMTVGA